MIAADLVARIAGAHRSRPGLPEPEPPHADGVAGRTAAAAVGHPAARRAVRRALRARRAVGRPASRRRRTAARRAGSASASRQFAVRRRARHGRGAPRRLDRRRRPRRRRTRRRTCSTAGRWPGLADIEASITRRYLFADRAPAPRTAAHAVGTVAAARHLLSQPARRRRRHAVGRLHRRHRGVRLGQVDAGRARCSAMWWSGIWAARSGQTESDTDAEDSDAEIVDIDHDASIGVTADGRRGDRPAGRRRPAADRADPALEAGHLHRDCSTRSGGSSPRRLRRAGAAGRQAGSRSTSPRGAAKPVRARASSRSNCCSCPALTPPARHATARATTRRRCVCATATAPSPTYWP